MTYVKIEKDKLRDHEWYMANRERILVSRKEYHKQNAETIRARVKKWKQENKNRVSEWRNSPEQLLKNRARAKSWVERNPEWHKRNVEKWRIENPLKVRASKKASKATRRLLGGILRHQTVQSVYEDNIKRYGTLTCCICLGQIKFGDDSLEHKIPISRGGTNSYENLGISHLKCNLKKATKIIGGG